MSTDFIPMLEKLLGDIKVTPEPRDAELLKKLTAMETGIFFDSAEQGRSQHETYEDVLRHVRSRYGDDDDRAKNADLKSAALASQASASRASRGAASGSGSGGSGGGGGGGSRTTTTTTTTTTTRTTTGGGGGGSGGGASGGSTSVHETKTTSSGGGEVVKTVGADGSVGVCAQCKEPITDSRFLENGDLMLHEKCLEDYENSHAPKCAVCKKNITGQYVRTGATADTAVVLHEECVEAYRRQTRPKCAKCGEPILETSYASRGGDAWHTGCVPTGPQ